MLYNDRCQSDTVALWPDPKPETPRNDWLPGCGPDGSDECAGNEECCHVYRGFNWTQSINTCREYGGEVVTPASKDENEALMNFISQIWSRRYNFNNEQWCIGGDPGDIRMISNNKSSQKLNFIIGGHTLDYTHWF